MTGACTQLFPRRLVLGPAAVMLALLLAACGPDYARIDNDLRHQLAAKDAQLADAKGKLANRDAQVTDLQSQLAGKYPPLATLPPDRLAQLFTAAKIDIRGNTDAWELGGKGISGFRIFIRTLSDDDQIITAAGTLTLEAFELPPSPAQPVRVGTWTFSPEDMKKNWYTGFGSDYFAFNCPWTAAPTEKTITFTAHFTDALTGRHLDATMTKTIKLPTASGTASTH